VTLIDPIPNPFPFELTQTLPNTATFAMKQTRILRGVAKTKRPRS